MYEAPRKLRSFILDQLRADGIVYFVFNYSACMAHCRNQKRLHDQANDPVRQAEIARYVDALYDAGDIK
jgi:hypothetical protein